MSKRKISKKDDRKELDFLWGSLEVAVKVRDMDKVLDIIDQLDNEEAKVRIFE